MAKKLPRASKTAFKFMGPKAQVLLFHGYTGSPYDLKPLGNYLHQHGYQIRVPLLKGHGTKTSDLYQVTAKDWLKQAIRACNALDKDRPIVVGGLSMGALLAILVSMQHRVQALLLFSPAFQLKISGQLTIAAAALGLLSKSSSIKKMHGQSDIHDPVARKLTPSYGKIPIHGLLEFEKLRKLTNSRLKEISCPTFLAFGKLDGAIDIEKSHALALQEFTQPSFIKFYENSKHIITLDYDREQLFLDVSNFLLTIGI
jgi:carboxylesterase